MATITNDKELEHFLDNEDQSVHIQKITPLRLSQLMKSKSETECWFDVNRYEITDSLISLYNEIIEAESSCFLERFENIFYLKKLIVQVGSTSRHGRLFMWTNKFNVLL